MLAARSMARSSARGMRAGCRASPSCCRPARRSGVKKAGSFSDPARAADRGRGRPGRSRRREAGRRPAPSAIQHRRWRPCGYRSPPCRRRRSSPASSSESIRRRAPSASVALRRRQGQQRRRIARHPHGHQPVGPRAEQIDAAALACRRFRVGQQQAARRDRAWRARPRGRSLGSRRSTRARSVPFHMSTGKPPAPSCSVPA